MTPSTARPLFSRPAQPSALAGVPAGVIAGLAYLAAQVLFALALGGTGSEPFQRIAAILLGPDAVPPPAEWSARVVGMALIIHLPLSAVYGRLVDVLVMRTTHAATAGALGAIAGAALFVLNRTLIAPHVFPGFDASHTLPTAVDHVLFGTVAALVCFYLRRHLAMRGKL